MVVHICICDLLGFSRANQGCIGISVCGYIGPSRQAIRRAFVRWNIVTINILPIFRSFAHGARSTESSECANYCNQTITIPGIKRPARRFTQAEAEEFLQRDRAATAAATAGRLGARKKSASPARAAGDAVRANAGQADDGVGDQAAADHRSNIAASASAVAVAASNRRLGVTPNGRS